MATKTSDLLSSLPSVSDLLEKPPIRGLVNRWNRSVVAAGVRSFLDELRSDLERRAADVSLPSIRELAERAARHVVQLQQPALRPTINATGRLWGAPWASVPLADAALERFVSVGRDFVRGPAQAADASGRAGDAAALGCRLTGAQSATCVHSYSGALWLFFSAVVCDQEFVVSRAELGDVDPGCSVPNLIASTRAVLREVGTTNRTAVDEYEAAISPRTAALLKTTPDNYRVVGETDSVELDQLVGLAREREVVLCEALGGAPLVEHPSTLGLFARSVQASLKAGADLVVVRGEGLIGGPPCGILMGRREVVRRIEEHPMFSAWQLDPPTAAALAATLELYEAPERLVETLPMLQLLSAPVDNLRDRAQRLAPQLAEAETVASAEPVATGVSPGIAAVPEEALPSYGVALTAADGNIAALGKRVAAAQHPLYGRLEADRLVLDLRTVFPRQDQELLEAVVGKAPPPGET